MDTKPEDLKRRLSGLTSAQRAQLASRLAATSGRTPATGAATAPMRREPSRRTETDARGRPVAFHRASNGQERMWFLHHYLPDSPVYCTPTAFHLRGPLDVPTLEAAFRHVADRHDSLRTTFVMEDGELVQRVAGGSDFRIEHLPAADAPASDARAAAERGVQEAACRPFDLTARPPWRVTLAGVGPDEHVLLVAMHHIISDGWSLSNLCREVAAAYAALAAGGTPAPAALPVQFADYAAWQRTWLADDAFKPQIDYWTRQLAGVGEPLDLPRDHPRPATESFAGDTCAQPLETELVAALRARAREHGATLFMVLLAAFNALLHRYSGQEDLLVGVPIANRQRLEVEGLIGFFANTLVLRTAVSGETTFVQLLDRVKETALSAYEHQDMPFELLVSLLQVRRDASRTPLFQASFALQDFPPVALPLPGLEVTASRVHTHTSKFDLSLKVNPTYPGLRTEIEYSRDLFEPDRARRLLDHWLTLLRGVAADPGGRVADLPLLSPDEERQLLVTWNDTALAFPRDQTIHGLFALAARRTPDAAAVRYGAEALTYRELHEQSGAFARHLRGLGLRPGAHVAVCVERSPRLLMALLGILKAGGTYVPLDPQFPPGRVDAILRDAAVAFLVTQRSLEARLPGFAGTRVLLDDWRPGAPDDSPPTPDGADAPARAAYVMFTSGSTGRPKGVAVEHRSVVNLLTQMRTQPGLRPDDLWLAVTSITFDISVVELFLPLSVGACVVLAPDDARADGAALAALLRDSGATVFQATPVTWKLLLRAGWRGDGKLKALTGGEALAPDLARQLLERCAELWNLYGPTETTIYSLGTRIHPGDDITIGKPLANTSVYIVDRQGRPTPVGVPGELWIGGEGVARGYLDQAALTADRFVPDPFSPTAGGRLYRTGDLCRWRADGHVEFLGRLDNQVKLRGYRIELGEIEAVLREAPPVREAVAALRDTPDGESVLAAYVTAHPGTGADGAALKAFLRTRLPEYMVPAHVEWLEALPLTTSGKVDRRALPAPASLAPPRGRNTEPPRNLLELNLAQLWQRIFGRDGVGRDDNFFDLGGHSILATRMVAEVEKIVGRRVPISALFQAPTVAALAQLLMEKDWAPPWSSLVPLQPAGSRIPIFCLHGLEGSVYGFLDFARAMAPERPVYGLQAAGLTSPQGPAHATVEAMAAHYAREIRSLRPAGPYHLIGHSAGGWLAYAVACELRSQGQEVSLLAVLDTQATAILPSWYKLPYLARRLRVHLRKMRRVPRAGLLRYVGARVRNMRLHLENSDRVDEPWVVSAISRYRPPRYQGDMDLFVIGLTRHWQWAFWKRLVLGRVYVHQTAGSHLTIVEKSQLGGFISILESALDRVEARQGSAAV